MIQFLADDLASEEGATRLVDEPAYPIWSPTKAFTAAQTLLDELEREEPAE